MKIMDKENIILKEKRYSSRVAVQSSNGRNQTHVYFCLPEEYFRFQVFKKEGYIPKDIYNWWTDSKIEEILVPYENRIFEYKKWIYDGGHFVAKIEK